MKKFVINYHTGVKNEVTANDLEDVKQIALEGIAYTQENVSIEDTEGNVLTVARWYSVEPEEDDQILTQIGNYGFYQLWEDEL